MRKLFVATLVAATAAAAPALAQLPAPTAPPPPNASLTGEWGPRRRLAEDGVTFSFGYISETAATLGGGKKHGSAYAQELNASATFDLGKLVGDEGGVVKIGIADREGVNLSATKIGSVMAVQEISNSGLTLRPSEFSYAQDLADARFNVKLGLIHTSDDFASSPINCNFQDGAFCPRPPMLSTNSGYSGYPAPRWGLRLKWRATRQFTFQTGIYEVNTQRGQKWRGWDLGVQDHGAFYPLEVTWTPPSTRLPGSYRVGVYYDSSRAADVKTDVQGLDLGTTGRPAEIRDGRSGFWLMGEQTVWRQGRHKLTLFSNVLEADKATARYGSFFNVGAILKGTIPGRPDDTAGVGFGRLTFNPRLSDAQLEKAIRQKTKNPAIQTDESVAEIFYGVQATRWMMLRPNLQYIIRPGATGQIPNAAVAGMTVRAFF